MTFSVPIVPLLIRAASPFKTAGQWGQWVPNNMSASGGVLEFTVLTIQDLPGLYYFHSMAYESGYADRSVVADGD